MSKFETVIKGLWLSCAFVLLLLSGRSYAQQKITRQGTVIIAAVGTDGVMLAADSRVTVRHNGKILAYYDGLSKIYRMGNFGLALIGTAASDRVYLPPVFSAFGRHTDLTQTPIEQIPRLLFEYIQKRLASDEFTQFAGNTYILTGYYKNTAFIMPFAFQPQAHMVLRDEVVTDKYVSDSTAVKFFNYAKELSCKQLAKSAEAAIYQSAKIGRKEIFVGGPIAVLTIKPDGTFVANDFCDFRETSIDTFAEDYRSGKIKLKFLKRGAKKELDAAYGVKK
jgi:hypothetical protein